MTGRRRVSRGRMSGGLPGALLGLLVLSASACSVPPPPPVGPAYQPEVRDQISLIRDDLYMAFRSPAPCLMDPGGMLCQAIRSGWTPELCSVSPDTPACALYRRQIATIEALGAQAPADRHAIGQAVFALTRSREFTRAERLVDGCEAEGWWCSMLRGHLLAEQGAVVEAEVVFDQALSEMPGAALCLWTDLSAVVAEPAWDALRSEDCQAQRTRAEVVWWLSDPAMMVPGNEAKVTWFSRMAWAELHDDQLEEHQGGDRLDDGRGHKHEHVEDLLRIGPHKKGTSTAWIDPITPTLRVVPEPDALLDPLGARRGDWRTVPGGSDMAISVPWGAVETLDAQVAFFERADSVLVVAAVDLPYSVVFQKGATMGAQLTLGRGPGAEVTASLGEARYRYRLSVTAERGRHLVAVEARSDRGVGRTRFGHGLPQPPEATLRLSDILLYRPGGSDWSEDLEEVIPLMQGGTTWATGDTLGVYLEVYGPEEVEDYSVSVTLESLEEGGLFRRLAEAVGLADPENPLELSWFQPAGGERFNASYTLALSELVPGSYALQMTFAGPGLEPATVRREIEVVERRRR